MRGAELRRDSDICQPMDTITASIHGTPNHLSKAAVRAELCNGLKRKIDLGQDARPLLAKARMNPMLQNRRRRNATRQIVQRTSQVEDCTPLALAQMPDEAAKEMCHLVGCGRQSSEELHACPSIMLSQRAARIARPRAQVLDRGVEADAPPSGWLHCAPNPNHKIFPAAVKDASAVAAEAISSVVH